MRPKKNQECGIRKQDIGDIGGDLAELDVASSGLYLDRVDVDMVLLGCS